MCKKKDKRKEKALLRKKIYDELTLDLKIKKLVDAGYDGKQLKKLRLLKEQQEAKKDK